MKKFLVATGIFALGGVAYLAVINKDKIKNFIDRDNPVNLNCWSKCSCHGCINSKCPAENCAMDKEEAEIENKFIFEDIDD